MTIRIVTDSTASLPADLLGEFGISVAPLYVVENGVATPDPEIDQTAFFERLRTTSTLPTTAQSSLEDLVAAFRSAAEAGADALGIFISEAMSGTAQAARVAADAVRADFPDARIEVVDSRSNSMQEGYAVLAAAAAAKAGEGIEGCKAACAEAMLRTRYLFSPATLDYLRKGGRIGTASALLGQLLQICPILTVDEGHTATFAKVRTHSKALAAMADAMARDAEQYGLARACVHYIADKETADRFAAERIEPLLGEPVRVLPVSAVIGVHVGPAVAVVYQTVDPIRSAV